LATDKELTKEIQTILNFLQNSLESATLVPNNTRLKPSSPSFARSLLYTRQYSSRDTTSKDTLGDDFGTTRDDFVKATIELCPKLGLPLNEQLNLRAI